MSAAEVDVAELLEDFGQDLTLRRVGTRVYNPATGTIIATSTPLDISVRGVFIYRDQMNADGTVIRGADRRLLITATGATGTPAVGDTVDGTKISHVRTFAPNGTVVAWDCKVDA